MLNVRFIHSCGENIHLGCASLNIAHLEWINLDIQRVALQYLLIICYSIHTYTNRLQASAIAIVEDRQDRVIYICFFYYPGPILQSKGMGATFQKKSKEMLKRKETFENLGKNIQYFFEKRQVIECNK